MAKRLPPGIGEDLDVPLYFNPYQDEFQKARRLRHCLSCKTTGSMNMMSQFTCPTCGIAHTSNLTAPRVFNNFLLLAGRGGGKTLIGAHAVREEMMVPNSIGWVMGPTYKILHDSTFPTLIRLIPPQWVENWDQEHMELRLTNGALVAFRSLEDPERARGPHGISWGWFDEAAQSPQRAYHVFQPTLIKAGGIVIATTTVLGFDWTYDEMERKALIHKEPGYWACRYWTEENPLFKQNPVMMAAIEAKRRTMPPDFFAQEYRAERRNATGLIYGKYFPKILVRGAGIKRFIPEYPDIDSSRQAIIGLDAGSDHPFGATLSIVTEPGIITVQEYLKRQVANSMHIDNIRYEFQPQRFTNVLWAANKNEAALRLEAALKGVGIMPAESKHEVGIQRVQSWCHSNQYFIYEDNCPKTAAQFQAYRYADNYTPDGTKKKNEDVHKIDDELPDTVRYGLMAFPSLPNAAIAIDEAAANRLAAMSDRDRQELEQMRKFTQKKTDGDRELQPTDAGFPLGDFHGASRADDFGEDGPVIGGRGNYVEDFW